MAHRFRELMVWQRAMGLVTDLYRLTATFPDVERYGLSSQIRRAAVSVPLNIAEGAGNDSPAEFCRFLRIAFRSTYELSTAIEIAHRLDHCMVDQANLLLSECDQIAAMLNRLIRATQSAPDKRLGEEDVAYTPSSRE